MVKKFEDINDELDSILRGKRSFWNLEAICHVSYEDICQVIRLHIHSKFEQWDQERPFSKWATEIVSNQIANLKEQYYGKFAPPCRTCESDLGSNLCEKTVSGIKCAECPLFAKWERKKEAAYRLVLAESADKSYYDEEEAGESRIKIEAPQSPDYFAASDRLHALVAKGLTGKLKQAYQLLYVEGRSDEYVAEVLGFRTTEKGKSPGYRQIFSMKKVLIQRAKKVMENHDVFSGL